MEIERTALAEVLLLKPRVFGDARGFFLETFRESTLRELGVTLPFVQDNHSRSRKGTLRGVHFQCPHAQGKLGRVPRGSVFDVAVDIRRGSPNFGKWTGHILNDENHHQLWVPPGFGHGFLVLSDVADFVYKCTEYYMPEHDGGFYWDDPEIGIDWPLREGLLLSDKDRNAPRLRELPEEKLPTLLNS